MAKTDSPEDESATRPPIIRSCLCSHPPVAEKAFFQRTRDSPSSFDAATGSQARGLVRDA